MINNLTVSQVSSRNKWAIRTGSVVVIDIKKSKHMKQTQPEIGDKEIDKLLLDPEIAPTPKSNMKIKSKILLKAFSQAENENFTKMVSFNTKEIEELSHNLLLQGKKSDEPKEDSKNEKTQQKSPTKSAIKK